MTAASPPLTVAQARAVLFGRTCTRRTRALCDAAWAVWLASPECATALAIPPAASLDPDRWTLDDAIHAADTHIMGAKRLRAKFGCPELEDHLPQGVDQFGNAY